jgi:hypothetical protein
MKSCTPRRWGILLAILKILCGVEIFLLFAGLFQQSAFWRAVVKSSYFGSNFFNSARYLGYADHVAATLAMGGQLGHADDPFLVAFGPIEFLVNASSMS